MSMIDFVIIGFVWGNMVALLIFAIRDLEINPFQVLIGFIPLTYLCMKLFLSP